MCAEGVGAYDLTDGEADEPAVCNEHTALKTQLVKAFKATDYGIVLKAYIIGKPVLRLPRPLIEHIEAIGEALGRYRLKAPFVLGLKTVAVVALCVQMSARVFGELVYLIDIV